MLAYIAHPLSSMETPVSVSVGFNSLTGNTTTLLISSDDCTCLSRVPKAYAREQIFLPNMHCIYTIDCDSDGQA